MYNTMFKNLKELTSCEIIIKASFEHMFFDNTITRTFILNIEDTENDDLTIKDYLNNYAIEHSYYLIVDSIEIFSNVLHKLNI